MTIDAAGARVVRVCRSLYERGLIAGRDGNVSVRTGRGTILVTPAGVAKGALREGDLVEVDPQGRVIARGTPSTELAFHLRILACRPDVNAVVHAHPPSATAMAAAGMDLMTPLLPETILVVGPVPLVPYERTGTAALADAVEPWLAEHDAFLLAHHGATTTGETLDEAHARMESLEHGARILIGAQLLGGARPLPAGEGEALLARWREERARRLAAFHASAAMESA
jgi:L-fuculose-phosphate aldolase